MLHGAAWSSFGLAALGVGIGTFAGIRAINARDTVDEECKPRCNAVGARAQEHGNTWETVGTTSLVVAGVALAAGVTFLVLRGHKLTTQSLVDGALGSAGVIRF